MVVAGYAVAVGFGEKPEFEKVLGEFGVRGPGWQRVYWIDW